MAAGLGWAVNPRLALPSPRIPHGSLLAAGPGAGAVQVPPAAAASLLAQGRAGGTCQPSPCPAVPAVPSFLCPPSPPRLLPDGTEPQSSAVPGVPSATTELGLTFPRGRAEHGDISFGGTRALRGPRLLRAKSQPTADLAAKLESTQMTEQIINPSTEPELIRLGCYWAFALLLFYGTPAKLVSIITQLRTHTFPAQGALCLPPSPKSLARRFSSLAAAVPAARSSEPGAGTGQACAGRKREPCCSSAARAFAPSLQSRLPVTLLGTASTVCGGCWSSSDCWSLQGTAMPCPLLNSPCPSGTRL